MYNNISGKIKDLAPLIFILGIVSSVIMGIALIMLDQAFIVFGVLIMILGSFVAWVLSCFAYGFGRTHVAKAKAEEIAE